MKGEQEELVSVMELSDEELVSVMELSDVKLVSDGTGERWDW